MRDILSALPAYAGRQSWALLIGPLAVAISLMTHQDSGRIHGLFYVVAIMAVGLGLRSASRSASAYWSRSAATTDAILLIPSGVLAASLAATHLDPGVWSHRAAPDFLPVLGVLHLAAVGLLVRRLPGGAAVHIGLLLSLTVGLPALVPLLRPALDASASFQPSGLARPIAVIASITAIVMCAIATPPAPNHLGAARL